MKAIQASGPIAKKMSNDCDEGEDVGRVTPLRPRPARTRGK